MSDRIAVMDRGRLVQLATAEELYNHPRNRFVADFIGKINIIPVKALGEENGVRRSGPAATSSASARRGRAQAGTTASSWRSGRSTFVCALRRRQ